MLTSCLRFLAVFRDTQGKFKRFSASLNRAAVVPHMSTLPLSALGSARPLSHIAKRDRGTKPLLPEPFAPMRKLTLLPKVSRPLYF